MKHHSIHTDSVRSGLVLHIWFGQNVGAKAISKLKISSAMMKKGGCYFSARGAVCGGCLLR